MTINWAVVLPISCLVMFLAILLPLILPFFLALILSFLQGFVGGTLIVYYGVEWN